MVANDPLSATTTSTWRIGLTRPGWEVQIRAEATMNANMSNFHTEHRLSCTYNGEPAIDRSWQRRIPRTSC